MNAPASSIEKSHSIGAILIDAGRLTAENAERVLRACRETGARFGDAAIELGVISRADVDFVLARQFDYTFLPRDDKSVSEELIAAFAPNSQAVESLRALRTQLMLRWFGCGVQNKSIAITSPARGEGRSWLAANLAVVFSQLGERTLLIDADMRHPRQHELFKLDNRVGLSAVLSGRAGTETVQCITPLLGLSVLPAGATPPNPQELLARPAFTPLIEKLFESFDVIIIDTPPAGDYADAQTIASRAGAALLVARKNISSSNQLRDVANSITQAGATLVGSVINEI
jgi:chain length determinant protein tyrosine kinase EpsG